MPRPPALQQLRNQSSPVKVAATNAPVEALRLVTEVIEVGGHDARLEWLARKDSGETAAGEDRSFLRVVARRAANSSDPGTYKSAAVRLATLVNCL